MIEDPPRVVYYPGSTPGSTPGYTPCSVPTRITCTSVLHPLWGNGRGAHYFKVTLLGGVSTSIMDYDRGL